MKEKQHECPTCHRPVNGSLPLPPRPLDLVMNELRIYAMKRGSNPEFREVFLICDRALAEYEAARRKTS